jgi:hypothetical protein
MKLINWVNEINPSVLQNHRRPSVYVGPVNSVTHRVPTSGSEILRHGSDQSFLPAVDQRVTIGMIYT